MTLRLPAWLLVDTARVVDDLLATGMFLPLTSGKSLLTWAYEQGLLP